MDYLQQQVLALVQQELGLEQLVVDLASDTYSFALMDHTFATSSATASAIAQIVSYASASSFIANMLAIASSSASTSDTLHYSAADPSHQD